jgi:hypothetical protein
MNRNISNIFKSKQMTDIKVKNVFIPIHLILIILLFQLSSCNGQVNHAKTNKEVNSFDSLLFKRNNVPEPVIFPNFINQIAETVRVMFHDSKGTYWFGTHGATFKLVNDSLIRVSELKSKSGRNVIARAIKEDINGKIWFGHTDGISF